MAFYRGETIQLQFSVNDVEGLNVNPVDLTNYYVNGVAYTKYNDGEVNLKEGNNQLVVNENKVFASLAPESSAKLKNGVLVFRLDFYSPTNVKTTRVIETEYLNNVRGINNGF